MTYCSTGHLAQAALEKEKKNSPEKQKPEKTNKNTASLFSWRRFFQKKKT